ncbi:hypothetical protein M011DRAFT_465229 [Sporormia fimetaria CBS 119925]|uniref:Uncharacterized protein n=1 Tax=Sporormia fimetaria CBS 119925 TaxID=1340428 RepID=A0A6A6VLP4_9PLEO|nr:hypothetical protein M011DRAFT_465229 [Sporormia fimetaria CBS 119925]
MPLPKRQVVPTKSKKVEDSAKKTEDSRFANFQSDAKYRLPSKKHSKTPLDQRFSRLLTDPDFYNKATVDKYGRKIDKDSGKKELARLYDAAEEEEEELERETDAARKRDKAVRRELAKAEIRGQGRDIIREGALESSSDESSSDEEEEEEEEVDDQAELADQGADIPTGEVTSRLAAVNMDWDNIRARDIMAVTNSFLPPGGKVLSVVIYPSEFGMERLQREELEGPPREIFASSSANNKDNITSVDDMEDETGSHDGEDSKDIEDGEEFDSKALRQYQLDRLRYYYAILTCSSPAAAKAIYDNMDGLEYLSSANFFDLRFVPDDTTFDEDPKDECERLPEGYKPNEFTTDALTHSKVKLTWDADDTERKEVQKRAFSRKEVDENELQAYLGSDSEDDEEAGQQEKTAALRAALGLDSSEAVTKSRPSKRDRDFKKPAGEMEITFSTGLSTKDGKGSVFENEPIIEETTIEKYIRKQKERKERRKQQAKALHDGAEGDAVAQSKDNGAQEEDDPWNDPFFADDPASAKAAFAESKKSQKAKKRQEKEKEEESKAAERANLELLMVDDEESHVRHFDMNEVLKAEKAKKKGKKKSKDAPVVEDNFQINTQDPRFAKLYESHEFAIDPTNPRFKGTAGMKALLEEGRKKRKLDRDDGNPTGGHKKQKAAEQSAGDVDDLKKLAARVKAKSRKA